MRSWQKWFIGQGTPLLTQELGSRGELQSKVMEDGDTTTHALQGECKTYRGCQSSGVTDSDSERQHEINMAVQTVQGKGHTDCREGGTETHTLAQTHICMFPSRTQHKECAPLGRAALQRAGLRTRNHSLIFAHIGTPGAHTAVSKAIFMCLHTCWPLLTHPHIQADIHTRSTSAVSVSAPPAGHRGSDLSLTQDSYLLTILSAGVEANRPRKERDNTQS